MGQNKIETHTPGQWVAFEQGMGDMVIRTKDKRYHGELRDVARVLTFHDAMDGSTAQADASLIARAPDMLEVLKDCITKPDAACLAHDSVYLLKRRLAYINYRICEVI